MKKLALLLASLLLVSPSLAGKKAGGKMTLYLEAMDGKGWQWFFLADTVRKGLPASSLEVYPLVTKLENGEFSSRRGEAELAEATRLALLSRDYPSRMLRYLNARSLSPSAEGWRDAALFAGINPDKLEQKAEKEGGKALELAHKRSSDAGAVATSLYLDGKPYDGSQRLMRVYDAVNAALPSSKRVRPPDGYKPKPQAPPPGFWVVLGEGMQKNSQLVAVFDKYFEGIKAQELAYGSRERAARFPDLAFVPSYVIAATPAAKKRLEKELLAGLFTEKGGYLVYEDRQRSGLYAGRKAQNNKLEVFVMSQCPYGAMAENAILAAEEKGDLPKGLDWEIHYIGQASKDKDGSWRFSSLHGQPEWEENARQLYIKAKFPSKFKAYLAERNKNYSSPDWKTAAEAAKINPSKVEKGFEEAKEMLAENFAATSALGVSTSPSFIVNGQSFMVGINELMKQPGFEKIAPDGQPSGGCN